MSGHPGDRGPWTEDPFPRPSVGEMARRWDQVRSLAREAGARAIVVAGHAAGSAEVHYLANVSVRWESLLVAPVDGGSPLLLLQLDNHAAGAADWSTVDIRVTGPRLAEAAARQLARWLGPGDPVGILGSPTERLGGPLRASLAGHPLVELGGPFLATRLTKGDEELAWVAWAAGAVDRAIAGFRAEARPGLREDELAMLLASHVVRSGAQPGICFMASAPAEGGEAVVPRQAPGRRRTVPGDLLLFELSAGMGGVTTQVLRTLALGGDAHPEAVRLHATADACFETLLGAVRPGVAATTLAALGTSIIEGAGMTIVDDLVHGYGGGYLPPVLRTTGTQHGDPPDVLLRPGMLLVLQPNVVSADRRRGVQTGELVAVTADGARAFHDTPRGLLAAPIA